MKRKLLNGMVSMVATITLLGHITLVYGSCANMSGSNTSPSSPTCTSSNTGSSCTYSLWSGSLPSGYYWSYVNTPGCGTFASYNSFPGGGSRVVNQYQRKGVCGSGGCGSPISQIQNQQVTVSGAYQIFRCVSGG